MPYPVRPNAFNALVDFMDQNLKIGIAGRPPGRPGWHAAAVDISISTAPGVFGGKLKLGLASRRSPRLAPGAMVRAWRELKGLGAHTGSHSIRGDHLMYFIAAVLIVLAGLFYTAGVGTLGVEMCRYGGTQSALCFGRRNSCGDMGRICQHPVNRAILEFDQAERGMEHD
jgi:hypothetical protein